MRNNAVYRAVTAEAAEVRLVEFETGWGERYSAITLVWRRAWKHVVPMFAFPSAIRKISIHGLTQQQCLPTVIKGCI